MIRNADWVIDLGPEGGDRGGRLVVQGTVSDLKKCSASHTGRIIKSLLKRWKIIVFLVDTCPHRCYYI